ncbi:heme peroxidase family protein [Reyranella sp.]|uniref:peroxidase family protein n=1 Tax=Reyranella sp. TaxID=1929291 RepID=UPI002717798F|nr:heme peroxidase family protein [Reyranella sp.]MDO8975808.1 heme peroxidase family protein [Reyranella sp.]
MPDTKPGTHGHQPRHDVVPPLGTSFRAGRFGRMVPELTSPFAAPDDALIDLGLAMVDKKKSDPARDNANIPACFTYLGQFIDHDITLDTTTLAEVSQDPTAIMNFRTPRLDLDSVYGLGPRVQPSLYDRHSPGHAKLLLGRTTIGGKEAIKAGLPHDLPRNPQGMAIIGDERNDENLLVAQTHVAFLRFHNAIVDRLAGTVAEDDLFDTARRAVVDLYQAMVIRDFLTKICDVNDVEAVLRDGRHFFRFETFGSCGQPYMPVEFSTAAYRLGHSMVREEYSHNRIFDPATFDLLFLFTAKSGALGTDGVGPANKPTLPSDWIIDWRRFADFGATGVPLNLSRNIDPYLTPALHDIGPPPPVPPTTPQEKAMRSLAVMNLRRGVKMMLPSAQDLANFMGIASLTPAQIGDPGSDDGKAAKKHGLHVSTPLWYYILKEAEVLHGGAHLGPLGSRLVAETFIGLLQGDPESILSRNKHWRLGQPLHGLILPGADESFGFSDLLEIAAGGTATGELSPVDDPANQP